MVIFQPACTASVFSQLVYISMSDIPPGMAPIHSNTPLTFNLIENYMNVFTGKNVRNLLLPSVYIKKNCGIFNIIIAKFWYGHIIYYVVQWCLQFSG